MNKWLVILIVGFTVYQGWGFVKAKSVKPLYDVPYLIVYGRDTCPATMQTVTLLKNAGVRFEYLNIDDRSVSEPLHARMRGKSVSTRRYRLPVVDLDNSIESQPNPFRLVRRAQALRL